MADSRSATPQELAARLEALAEKITPGPWAPPNANLFRLYSWVGREPLRCIIADAISEAHWGFSQVPPPPSDVAAANVALIATMRNALPEIIAALRAKEPA